MKQGFLFYRIHMNRTWPPVSNCSQLSVNYYARLAVSAVASVILQFFGQSSQTKTSVRAMIPHVAHTANLPQESDAVIVADRHNFVRVLSGSDINQPEISLPSLSFPWNGTIRLSISAIIFACSHSQLSQV